MSIPKETALKRLRAHVLEALEKDDDMPPQLLIPWEPDGEILPLPFPSPAQSEKLAVFFRLGYMVMVEQVELAEPPGEPEYVLTAMTMWMVSRVYGQGLVGSPSQQPDRQEVLQILHSTPQGVQEGWLYQVHRSNEGVALRDERHLASQVRSPLLRAFWAGVDVGKEQAEVMRVAGGGLMGAEH